MKKNYKKGFLNSGFKSYFSVGESIQLLIVIFLFAILAVVGFKVFGEVNTDIQADTDINPIAKAELDDLHDRFPETFDGAFITIFALLFVLGIVSSLLFDSHPAFLIVVVVIMAFLMVASGFISNSWSEFMSDSELSSFTSSFPITNWFLQNLLLVIGVSVITFGSIIYFKRRI